MSDRRERKLDSISDALLSSCEDYLRAVSQNRSDGRIDRLADAVQQLWKQRIRSGDVRLPFPLSTVIPTKQLEQYDTVYSSQFLDWVAAIHKELKSRTVTKYA